MGRRAHLTLERLAVLPLAEVKAQWTQRYGAPAPNLSPDLLRLGIGYKLQEQKLGGVDRGTRALLRQLRRGQGRAVRPNRCHASSRPVPGWSAIGTASATR
jgi:hypothetical protein